MMRIRVFGRVAVLVAGVVAIGVGLLAGGVGVAQAPGSGKRAMTFADLMAMKRVSDPQISPSGKWVMFSVTDVDLGKNTKVNHLWVVPLGGGEAKADSSAALRNDKQGGAGAAGGDDERQVTFGAGESFGRFSPDGKWVSMTVGDDIYLAEWDEAAGAVGEAKQLTRVSGGGADGAVWSPDSKRLMFVAEVWPECSVKGTKATTTAETNTGVLRSAQNDSLMGGGGTPEFVVGGTREVGGGPTHDGVAVMNGARSGGANPTSQNRDVGHPHPTGEAASWVEEDGCDKARDEAVGQSAVKGQVWDGLFYRHWDHYTGAKRSHVLVVNVDGTGVRDLTPATAVGDAETPTFSLGGPLGYAWAPDSKEIAYVTNLDAVPAASTNNDVFTLRLDEVGARAVKVSTSPGSDDGPAYSPDGKWLAWRSQARGGFESDLFRLALMDRQTGDVRFVSHAKMDYSDTGNGKPADIDRWVDEFLWSADSKSVYFAAGDRGQEPIYRIDIDGGELRRYGRVRGEWSSLAGGLVGGEYTVVGMLMRVDRPAEVALMDRVGMDDGTHEIKVSLDGKAPSKDITPTSVDAVLLTHQNDALTSQLSLPPLEPFWFTGAEGTKVEGFLLRPPGFVEGKKYPVKFLMHGGPQTAWGDSWSYRWNWELMAASGYVVIGINRRGSTGYGQKFVDEVSGDWGGRAYEDLMKGLDYAEAKFPFIDKTRECALGASYGGFMADWVLTHTDRFKCIVTHDGMYDPVAAYGATEEMWFNEWEFRRPEDFPKGWDGFEGYDPMGKAGKTNTEILTGGQNDGQGQRRNAGVLRSAQNDNSGGGMNGRGAGGSKPTSDKKPSDMGHPSSADGHAAEPWRYAGLAADEDPFRRWSPMRFIQNAKTPTLVIHSQKDYRLDVSQGLELFTALQRLGVPSRMLYFPDEGHWVLKPQNAEVWNEVVADWCDRWTKSGKYAAK